MRATGVAIRHCDSGTDTDTDTQSNPKADGDAETHSDAEAHRESKAHGDEGHPDCQPVAVSKEDEPQGKADHQSVNHAEAQAHPQAVAIPRADTLDEIRHAYRHHDCAAP